MKKIVALLFLITNFSCDKVNIDENNISIKNADLKNKILEFNENAKFYTKKNTDSTVSVVFWKDYNQVRIGLYSSKKMKNDDYIGKTKINNITAYFYSNEKSVFKDLIDVKFKANKTKNKKDVSDTYTSFYVYKNGKLELIRKIELSILHLSGVNRKRKSPQNLRASFIYRNRNLFLNHIQC